MKKIIFSFFLFAFSSFVFSQKPTDDYYPTASVHRNRIKDRISTSITAGTSVSFLSTKNTIISSYIFPKINYQFSKNFRLNFGLMHFNSQPDLLLSDKNENINSCKKNYSSNLLFLGGEYRLNNKTTILGSIIANTASFNNKLNSYKAAAIGINYKVSEHSTIGIHASVSQGNQDFIFNSRNNSYNYNPSLNNTFGNIFTEMGQWGVNELNRAGR
jgi:hypothetical protein